MSKNREVSVSVKKNLLFLDTNYHSLYINILLEFFI
jgi:hypothetical protein